jgi:neurotransmitter:Na+ symporter, NSS family
MQGAAREHWSSRTGFVLAAIGSAVGLGNMWRFSYLAAENGGAAFVIFYVIITLLVGLPVLLAELAIGRGSQQSPIRALAHFGGARWKLLGVVFVAAGFLILSYYSVIAGWTLRYALIALTDGFGPDAATRFEGIATGWDAFGFHVLFMAITIAIVGSGVKRGIERTSMVLMPALFVIVVGLAFYAATLDGSAPGYAYYLAADPSKLFHWSVLKDAAGQAFFSLSLGMGAMLTFASYLDRDQHLPNESLIIAGADLAVAFVAGLVVFPLIFALGLEARVGGSTVGALFITLPQAFAEMGAMGRVVGLLFFAALVVGALTSAISLLEVVVASAIDSLGMSRARAAVLAGFIITALGAPSAWSTAVLGVMDQVANNLFLLGGGLALACFVGWFMPDPVAEVRAGAENVRWFNAWLWLLRIAVPVFLALVLWSAVPETLRAVRDLLGS